MSRYAWILALIAGWAVLGLSGPVSAGTGHGLAAGSGSAVAPGEGPEHHCSHGDSESGGHEGEESGDCCPNGCDACPTCTGGVSALHGARIDGPSAAPIAHGRGLSPQRGPASADPGGIYHPPRA